MRSGRDGRWEALLEGAHPRRDPRGQVGRALLLEALDRLEQCRLPVASARVPVDDEAGLGRVARDAHVVAVAEGRDIRAHRVLGDVQHREAVVDGVALRALHRGGRLHRKAHVNHQAVCAARGLGTRGALGLWRRECRQREAAALAHLQRSRRSSQWRMVLGVRQHTPRRRVWGRHRHRLVVWGRPSEECLHGLERERRGGWVRGRRGGRARGQRGGSAAAASLQPGAPLIGAEGW